MAYTFRLYKHFNSLLLVKSNFSIPIPTWQELCMCIWMEGRGDPRLKKGEGKYISMLTLMRRSDFCWTELK